MNIDAYNSAIRDTWIYLLLNMLPIFIGGIILIVIALIGLSQRIVQKSIAFLLLILSFITLAYPIIEISVFNYDIQHANYEVYCGEFEYMQVSGNRKDVLEFSNKTNLYVRSVANLGINTGVHSGYVIYCKTSRWVIAYTDHPFE